MHARDYQPGEQVPGTVYRVVRLIGAGGMGTVYDVEDTTIGKRYVLKTLHPQLGAREDLARRMQNEARTLARLNHTNIVEVFTAGVTSDDLRLPYYVMERLNGQSLRLVLDKKGKLELQHAYHIGIDLLEALDHAHDKGVIHRDVKPDNIFLHRTPAGLTLTKLLDFGIVSVLDSASRETAGRFVGTLRYAAPEQLRGEKPTPKTDIYAAGLVLYEMVAGRGPFDDERDPHRIGAAHLNRAPPPITQFVPVPRELETLLMATLSKNTEDRPRDAFSFAARLRNLKRNHHAVGASAAMTESAFTPPDGARPAPGRSSVSTARGDNSAIGPAAAPTSLPVTTVPGMMAVTRGQSVVTPGALSAAGSTHAAEAADAAVSAVKRAAPLSSNPLPIDRAQTTTHAAVDAQPSERPSAHAVSPNRTASFASATTTAQLEPFDFDAFERIEWPIDPSPSLSVGPHVRSLQAPALGRPAGRAVALVALAALAITATLVVLSRTPHGGASAAWIEPSPAEIASIAAAAARAPTPPPSAASVVAIEAPVLVPALGDPASLAERNPVLTAANTPSAELPAAPSASPSTAPSASSARASAAHAPAPRAVPSAAGVLPPAKKAPVRAATTRPGPGF